MSPQAFIFLGRSGSGKGTQAELLIADLKRVDQDHPTLHIETGKLFRELSEGEGHTAAVTKNTLLNGALMPEFMCIYAWGKFLVDRYTNNEHMVFDGTPRKLDEAKMLDSVFPFYGVEKPWVIYLDVDHESAKTRLLNRGRNDDTHDAISKRMEWYENEVRPTVEHYRKNQNVRFLDIDGEGSIEEVHAEIAKRLGLA